MSVVIVCAQNDAESQGKALFGGGANVKMSGCGKRKGNVAMVCAVLRWECVSGF